MRYSRSLPSFDEYQKTDKPERRNQRYFSRTSWRLIVLLVVWYGSSSFQNIWGKSVLKKMPRPMTLTMAQFATINVILPVLMSLWNKRRRTFDNRTYRNALVPLSLLKLLASLSSFLTLLKVPVSYAHTVKALMPLASVTLSRIVLGEQHTWRMYATIIPIVCGVVIASATEIEFNMQGLIAALGSTLLLSFQSIFSKKAMISVDHLNLLLVTSQICMVLFAPLWLYYEGWSLLVGDGIAEMGYGRIEVQQIMLQLLGASILNATQTVAAFTFLALVPPVTYSVANVSKRVVVITLSIVYFGQKATTANILGMSLAICGVALYNYAKIIEAKDKKKYTLPSKAPRASKTEWII